MADQNDGFVEVGAGDSWQPEPGESITGEYVQAREGVGPNKSWLYVLKTTDDGDMVVWGSTVLDGRMERVRLGDTVRITFTGLSKEKGKFGKPWKEYRVEVKPGGGTGAGSAEPKADDNINLDDLPY